MNTITRGFRNAFRNNIRTFSIITILGLSIGLALAMLVARGAVKEKITSVKSSIGNTVTVSPAGARGFQGGGEPLTSDQLAKVAAIPNVSSTVQMLSDRLTTENTNLVSAIDAGTLGNRAGNNSGVGFTPPADTQGDAGSTSTRRFTRTFTPPLILTGTNSTDASVFGGSTVSFTSGKAFDPTADKNEAVVGKALAEKNNLSVGSTFTAYTQTVTVVGIYDAGNTFANAGLVMSLPSVQHLSGQANDITNAVITVNSIDNVDSVVSSIKSTLGDKADVVSSQDTAKEAVAPLESVRTVSTYSLIGAIVAGSIIILLTMVMIVRERRREIGVYKAIGASNFKIMSQFISEAVTLTLLAMVAGVIIGSVSASPITKVLVNNSTSSQTTGQTAAGGQTTRAGGTGQTTTRSLGNGVRTGGPGLRTLGGNTLANARNIQATVGWSILAYGFAAAMLIAVIGSAIPAFLISKIRPAEVMRAE